MQKKARQLTLRKETVRKLDITELVKANGGNQTHQCSLDCDQYDTTLVW